MKNIIFLISAILLYCSAYTQNIDSTIVKMWYRADSVNIVSGKVKNLYNTKKGNIISATQNTSSNQPTITTNALNSYPAIKFDGVNDFFLIDSVYSPSAFLVVFKIDAIPSFSRIFDLSGENGLCIRPDDFEMRFNSNSSLRVLFGDPTTGYYMLLAQKSEDATGAKAYIGNTEYDLGTNRSFNSGKYSIGAHSGSTQAFNGQLFEMIIFNSIPNEGSKTDFFSYLRNKYSPPVNLGADINIDYGFSGTTISANNPRFTNYIWSNGETNSEITVNKSGTYSVTVTDIFGFESSDFITVTYPQINNLNDTTICLNDTIIWNTKLGNTYNYQWQGGISTTDSLSIFKAGKYSVRVTDSNGYYILSDTLCVVIDSFSLKNTLGADRSVCNGEAITLIEKTSDIKNWLWNTGANIDYINVLSAGDYWVEVSNMRGCKLRDSISVSISGQSPTVLFTFDTVCYGSATKFINKSTIILPDYISTYHWDFGNGLQSNDSSPELAYPIAGSYKVTLTATSQIGCNNFYSDSIIVKHSPDANFYIENGNVHCVASNIKFFDNSQIPETVYKYYWNFGNQDFSQIKDPIYTYIQEGYYNVTHSIELSNGCTDSITHNISVFSTLPLPDKPLLNNPSNYSYYLINDSINFSWSTSGEAFNYKLEISTDIGFNNIIYSIQTTNNQTSYKLLSSGIFYWRVKALNLCSDYSTSQTSKLIVINPITEESVLSWYSADTNLANGSLIGSLNDKMPAAISAIQNTTTNRPVIKTNALNGYPSINFDGINDFLTIDSAYSPSAFLIIIKIDSLPAFSRIFDYSGENGLSLKLDDFEMRFNSNSSLRTLFGDPTTGYYMILAQKSKGTTGAKAYIGNTEYELGINRTFNSGQYTIGAHSSGTQGFKGQLFEMLIFKDNPPEEVRNNLFGYFRQKYAPALNLGADINIAYGFSDTSISAYKPWFKSYIWNTGSTDSLININKSGTYSVTVTDIFGFQSSDTIKVTLTEPTQLSDTTICWGDTIIWNTNLTGNYLYQWSTTQTTPSIKISQGGNYRVKITDTLGNNWYSDTITITVDNFPNIVSLGNDTTLCQGNRLYLQNGRESAVSFLWSDNTTQNNIILQNTGEYSVTATNSLGCIANDTISITINGIAPQVDFAAANLCFNDTVQFTNLSLAPEGYSIISQTWNFGNSEISNQENPQYSYISAGNYNVELKVTSNNDCSNSYINSIQIYNLPQVYAAPPATCSYALTQMADLSISTDGAITQWLWTFPNDSISTEQNPAYTFTSDGENYVTLNVITQYGCKGTGNLTVLTKTGPNTNFYHSPACYLKQVYFTDQTESFLNLPLYYEWYINDSLFSYVNNPSITFPDTGTYTIKLKTTQTSNLCSGKTEKTIKVYRNPVAAFDVQQYCKEQKKALTENSYSLDSDLTQWLWKIDSIGYLTNKNPEISFSDEGNYNTTLTVTDENGCNDTSLNIIIVHPVPVVDFEATPKKGAIPLNVKFTNYTSGAETYYWNFNDSTESQEYEPVHIFNNEKSYNVLLKATSENGCSDSTIKVVRGINAFIDLAILSVSAEINNGYLSISAILQNRGTLDMDNIDIKYHTNLTGRFKEIIKDTIYSGQTYIYEFATKLELNEYDILDYVCVQILLPSTADNVPTDNEKCVVFTKSFKPAQPYPNPANGFITSEYIIPFKGNVKIWLIDAIGKNTKVLYENVSEAGYNRHTFDIQTVKPGLYQYMIEYDGNIVTYPIII